LAKNWTTFLQDHSRLPETVDEAVERLMSVLEDEHKAVLAFMQEEDLIDLQFSLGLAIRNAFDLHVPWSKLLASCAVVHPDDASGLIIQALCRRLRASSEA
jgi:hypothetical protein